MVVVHRARNALRLPLTAPLLLALGTWIVYVADRVLDGFHMGTTGQLRERHFFYARHRSRFLIAGVIVGLILIWLVATRMTAAARLEDIVLFAVALAYFFLIHLCGPSSVPVRNQDRALVRQGSRGRRGVRRRSGRACMVEAAGRESIADARGRAIRIALLAQLHGHRKMGALAADRCACFDCNPAARHHPLGAAAFAVGKSAPSLCWPQLQALARFCPPVRWL